MSREIVKERATDLGFKGTELTQVGGVNCGGKKEGTGLEALRWVVKRKKSWEEKGGDKQDRSLSVCGIAEFKI